jgi:arylsulfatase A-like enzyme
MGNAHAWLPGQDQPDACRIRTQCVHGTDVMPTLLDLAGRKTLDTINRVPALPLHGKSFAPLLFDAAAPSPRTAPSLQCH